MVYIYLADGFEETEAVTIVDIMRRGGADVSSVSVTGSRIVAGAHGIALTADLLFEEADHSSCEMIVMPGGMPGAKNLAAHEGLTDRIKEFAAEGKWLAAICAAPMVLAGAGVLNGKTATIYPGMEDRLTGAKAVDSPIARDGKIITSQSPGTAMVFALYLLTVLKGEEKAAEVEEGLCMS